jgi:hypothetical protein
MPSLEAIQKKKEGPNFLSRTQETLNIGQEESIKWSCGTIILTVHWNRAALLLTFNIVVSILTAIQAQAINERVT